MAPSKIAVLGTGANGAGIGANLIDAGHDVTYIEQWPAHVEAMRTRGLVVHCDGTTTTTTVDALHLCQVAELREPFDLVFLVVKAYDTRWATELIKPLVAPSGLVIGLQNGMSAGDIADIVGVERTIGAVIEVGSNMFEPGVVTRDTPVERSWFALGALPDGPQERVGEAATVLRAAGTVEIVDDILSAKWMKLVVNAAELVSSAIVDMPMMEAVRLPGMRDFMVAAGREALRTAHDLGHRTVPILGLEDEASLGADDYVVALIDAVFNGFAVPGTLTTVHQDWMKGRHSEVNEINGLVVRERTRLGGHAPANAVMVDVALAIERGDEKPGQHLLPRLLSAVDLG